jgi:hypothetical protein
MRIRLLASLCGAAAFSTATAAPRLPVDREEVIRRADVVVVVRPMPWKNWNAPAPLRECIVRTLKGEWRENAEAKLSQERDYRMHVLPSNVPQGFGVAALIFTNEAYRHVTGAMLVNRRSSTDDVPIAEIEVLCALIAEDTASPTNHINSKIALLRHYMLDDKWTYRVAAMNVAIEKFSPETLQALEPDLMLQLHHDERQVIAAAVRGLGQLNTSSTCELLARHATDPQSPIRLEALTGLGLHKDKRKVPLLKPMLKDPVPSVREQACRALKNTPDKSIVPALIDRIGDDNYAVRRAACDVLGSWTGEPIECFDPYDKTKPLRFYVGKWQRWWRKNESTIRLREP